jgi:Aspartyl protease
MWYFRYRIVFLAWMLTASLALSHAAGAACVVAKQQDVPVDIVAGVPVASVQVNTETLPFVLDTGAQRSLITDAAVQRANVRLDEWASTTVRGVSGYERHRNADPSSLQLGGVALRRRTMAADQTMTVGPLPQSTLAGHAIAGLLGADFLAGFDLDFDLPHRQITLYRVAGCAGRFLPWPPGYDTIPAIQPIRDILVMPIELSGRTLRALIDSGSAISLLTASGIDRVGLTPDLLAQDPAGAMNGVGRFTIGTRRHHFDALRVGAERIADPTIWAAPVHILPIVDMLLGGEWLRSRRVWLSYTTSQVFVMQGH